MPYVGEIRMFAGSFAPAGWAFCSGQQLPISENDVLFQLIGTTYGGDGQSTFNLPNLQSRVPIHQGTGNSGTTYQIGEMAGVEAVTLTINQMPAHNHGVQVSTSIGNDPNADANVLAESSLATMYVAANPSADMASQAIGPVGGSQPHSNVQPYLGINFIISLFGQFPSQT
jgi:microcystin-dependent protein